MKQAAFIGTGNMGGALARAACRALGADNVVLTDHDHTRAEALARELGCSAAPSNAEAVQSAHYVFLCVKPQVLPAVLAELAPVIAQCEAADAEKVLVSIAAGVQLEAIRQQLSPAAPPLLRVMPNTCAAIGQGMLALAAADGTAERHLEAVEEILSCAGRVERLNEAQMDAFTAVAGCGPAYVYQFIEALADGGVMAGLPRAAAQTYAAQTVLGAAAMVLQSGQHPGALKDAVCSPGGSTIAGVAELERHAFRAAAIDAVLSAWKANIELGQHK